jgi:C4-dicarboxylate-binding protein DctP
MKFMRIRTLLAAERNAASTEVNEQAKQSIIEAGGGVRTLTAEGRQERVDAMKPVWSEFQDAVGEDLITAARSFSTSN